MDYQMPPHVIKGQFLPSNLHGKVMATADAINRMNDGIFGPSPTDPPGTPTPPSFVYSARLVLTDTTATLSGLSAIDGVTPLAGDLICVFQGVTATDGLYFADSSTWLPFMLCASLFSGTLVSVFEGNTAPTAYSVVTISSVKQFQLLNAGSPTAASVASVASTTSIASRTGTPSIDGFATSAGNKILLKDQAGSTNGLWQIPVGGGAWVKIGQPTAVFVVNGTLSGSTCYFLSAANTYTGVVGFWG